MGNALDTAHRLITREATVRAAGTEPLLKTVEKTITFVIDNALYADDQVRAYLLSSAGSKGDDYYIATKLLDTILPMCGLGLTRDAEAIFKTVIRYNHPGAWYAKGVRGSYLLLNTALSKILGDESLLFDEHAQWGEIATSLLDAFLLEDQRHKWPSKYDLRHTQAADSGDTSTEVAPPFAPIFDDPMVVYQWRRDEGGSRTDPHRLITASLEKALLTSLNDETPTRFQRLADRLLGSKWSYSVSLPLRVLLDHSKGAAAKPWHTDAAVAALTTPSVESFESLVALRRVLRVNLLGSATPTQRNAVLETIRSFAVDTLTKANELWDVRDWTELSAGDRAVISAAESAQDIAPARDPREPLFESGWRGRVSMRDTLAAGWPKESQRPLIDLLHNSQPANNSPITAAELQTELVPQLDALETLLQEEAATDPAWKWYFVYWADKAIDLLRRLTLLEQGKDPKRDALPLTDFVAVLTARASWWKQLAEWAIEGLSSPVPQFHHDQKSDSFGWSPTDPIFASASYLDELLAVENGEPFDSYRARFGDELARVWTTWPVYTKAVILFSVRNYHWVYIPQLNARAVEAVSSESAPRLIIRCLGLVSGLGNKVHWIRDVLNRLPQLSGAGDLANHLGQLLGGAVIQSRSGEEFPPELSGIATTCDELLASPRKLGQYALAFAQGAAWGAREIISESEPLTSGYANAWTPFARSLLQVAFVSRPLEAPMEGILQAVLSVMQRPWPESIRTKLYDELLPSLEHVIRQGSLGDVSWLHYLLGRELDGDFDDIGGEPMKKGTVAIPLAPRDEVLVQICKASAERVLAWARAKTTTNDIGWVSMLSGRDTAELIRKTYESGRDVAYLQRTLPAVIDILGEAGLMDVATDLRLLLRRGRGIKS